MGNQAAQANHLFLGGCPAGYTGSQIGTGAIIGDVFTTTGAEAVFQCTVIPPPTIAPAPAPVPAPAPAPPPVPAPAPVVEEKPEQREATINTLQVERTTTNSINAHIMPEVVKSYILDAKLNKEGASADSDSYMPDAFWGETNVSSLTEHNNKLPGFASNIYQFVGGLDKRQGDAFYGAALTYAYTDNNLINNTDSVMHTVGITPYMAYKINDFLFASALASYYYSNTSGSAGNRNIDTHDYQGEVNINTFKVIDSFVLKGRAGVRYKHANSSLKGGNVGRDNTYDEITGIVDCQIDYNFDNGLTLFTGALYNHYAREASGASTLVKGNDVVWMRYGAEYPITKGFLLGAKIENDLNDKQINYLTGSINFRLEL